MLENKVGIRDYFFKKKFALKKSFFYICGVFLLKFLEIIAEKLRGPFRKFKDRILEIGVFYYNRNTSA